VILPSGYIPSWKGSIILLDMNEWDLSPSLGNNGSQTIIPWAPQNSHRASVRWGFSRRDLRGTQTFSTRDAKTVGGAQVYDWN